MRELYLDGCDKITTLEPLINKRRSNNVHFREAIDNQLLINQFQSLALLKEDRMDMMLEMSKGGAHGLEVISLAECKNVTDEGVVQ